MVVGRELRGVLGGRHKVEKQHDGARVAPGKRQPTTDIGRSRASPATDAPPTRMRENPSVAGVREPLERQAAEQYLTAAMLGAELPADVAEQPDSYPGEFESLDRSAVASLDDSTVRSGVRGARHALARLEPAGPEYQTQRQNLAILEMESSQRDLDPISALPNGHGWVGPGGIVLFDDPIHARMMLEQQIAARGVHGAHDFVRECRVHIFGNPVPAGPSEESSQGHEILSVLETQLHVLEQENARFEQQFERQALATAHAILDESERRVCAEMERYGMNVDRANGFSGASALDIPETQEMQAAAGMLLQSMRTLRSMRRQHSLAAQHAWMSSEDDFDGDFDAKVDEWDAVGGLSPEEDSMLADMAHQLESAELEHEQLRTTLEAEYPSLARYTEEEQLERITQEHFGPRQVAWDLDENLHNIEQTRAALNDALSVFRLPQVVEMTATEMLVVPGTVRARIVDDRVSRAQPSVFDALATSALAIGLGLIAALPTGGSSLGVAAVVTTAGLAGVALEGYLVHDAVRRYQVEKAAGGTDPDKARALAQEEPSLFWLAVTIVGAGLGGGTALQTFRDIARIRRAALASEESGQLVERLRELQRLSEESRFSPDVGARLTEQILDEHASVDIAVEARRLLGSGTRSRQSLSDEELESAIAYAEELGMSRKLIDTEHPDDSTSWGQVFGREKLYICNDLKPSPPNGRFLTANQRVSERGAIAHELVGHRESTLAGSRTRFPPV